MYFRCEEDLKSQIKSGLKRAYDFSKSQEIVVKASSALPQLFVKNFDTEQIWQQLELQNDELLSNSLKTISKLLVNKDKLVFSNLEKELNEQAESNSELSGTDSDESNIENVENRKRFREPDDDNVTDSDGEIDLRDADGGSAEEDEEAHENAKPSSTKSSRKKSVVDDEFFKLEEMEKFLEDEEKKMNEPDSGNDTEEGDEESEDDDGSVDLFKEDPEDEEDNVRTAKFKDFFVAKEEQKPTKRNKFLEEMSDDGDREQIKSTLELRQERLQKRIDSLEEKAISEKPWTLKGEIKADDRPQNSLLEEVVEFDMTSRPGKSVW